MSEEYWKTRFKTDTGFDRVTSHMFSVNPILQTSKTSV